MTDKHVDEFEFLPGPDDYGAASGAPKPLNHRTKKTVWKERRRRANLPRSVQKRLRLASA